MRICLSECFEVNAIFDWLNKYLRARVCHLFSLRKTARSCFFISTLSAQLFSLLSSTTITTSPQQIKEQQFCEIFFLIYDFCIPGVFVKNIEGQFSFRNHVSSLTAKIYKDSIRFLRNFL